MLRYKITALVVLLCLYPPQSHSFDNENPTVFITGSNRNIGLEFVKQFVENNWNVIATARNPEEAKELQIIAAEQDNVVIEQLDVTENCFTNSNPMFLLDPVMKTVGFSLSKD